MTVSATTPSDEPAGGLTLSQLASDSYRRFSGFEGNQHIASEFALAHALEIIRRWKVSDVLEVGLGIGSMSCTILTASARGLLPQAVRYCGTEKNAFCLEQLPRNLGPGPRAGITIFESLDDLSDHDRFDLIIIDGADARLKRIPALMKPRGLLFIEGDRREQLDTVRRLFPDSLGYRAITTRKNPPYGPFPRERWIGGCSVVFTQPTLRQRLDWARQRVLTSVRYRIRRVKS